MKYFTEQHKISILPSIMGLQRSPSAGTMAIASALFLPCLLLSVQLDQVHSFQTASSKLQSPLRGITTTALREQSNDPTADSAVESSGTAAEDAWIKQEFESPPIVCGLSSGASSSLHTSSAELLDQGAVIGPARVLVYDTTLRGENM